MVTPRSPRQNLFDRFELNVGHLRPSRIGLRNALVRDKGRRTQLVTGDTERVVFPFLGGKMRLMMRSTTARTFDEILATRALSTVFQPIVRLETGLVEGYEALVRGPADSPLASADALLAEAYRTGRVVEFDWAARASACRAALDGQLGPDRLLFLNIEPIALGSECPPDLRSDIEQAFGRFQIVLEVTERSLGRDPRALLNGIDRQRPDVAGLALDDVGSGRLTVALLAVLSVDVIKLDRAIIQGGCSPTSSKILDIAHEGAERTGATILAEGVESAALLRHALAVGAELAQGYYLGEPQALPAPSTGDRIVGDVRSEPIHDVRTPFDAIAGRPLSRAAADLLLPLSRQVAFGETHLSEPAMVIHLVPGPDLFDPADQQELTRLAARGVIAGALGRGVPAIPVPGVRRTDVHDPTLDGQWTLLALSPSAAGALIARAVPDSPEFEYTITHDRRRVVTAARCLFRRFGPPPETETETETSATD
jgi:EAL domain-containing protein (putative c-di-GMP-specific phosphodiesterase class I)